MVPIISTRENEMAILRINNRILKKNGTVLTGGAEPPSPSLPPYTLRLQFLSEPVTSASDLSCNMDDCTWTKVDADGYVWDWTYEDPDWGGAFDENPPYWGQFNVIAANTTGVTAMWNLFYRNGLVSVCDMDTSSVTDMNGMFTDTYITGIGQMDTSSVTNFASMFENCPLTAVPLLDTSSADDVSRMFFGCTSVSGGAYAMYQQMSTQANPPTYHSNCFYNCGSNTVTGAAELAQIPSDWK